MWASVTVTNNMLNLEILTKWCKGLIVHIYLYIPLDINHWSNLGLEVDLAACRLPSEEYFRNQGGTLWTSWFNSRVSLRVLTLSCMKYIIKWTLLLNLIKPLLHLVLNFVFSIKQIVASLFLMKCLTCPWQGGTKVLN